LGRERTRRTRDDPRPARGHREVRRHRRGCGQAPHRLRLPRPTLAFPVPGTLMVEPTESEDKAELDRFIEAMRTIRAEIDAIGDEYSYEESPLAGAPHPATVVMDDWDGKYSRETAVFPAPGLRLTKYFPP